MEVQFADQAAVQNVVNDNPDPPDAPPNEMDTALLMIGFENDQVRERLRAEGFETFDDLKSMKEKDIRDLADSYTRRTVADGRFIFGVRRIRYLIGIIHWVQDFGRVSGTPSLDEYGGDAGAFRAALDVAFDRAEVRKVEKEQSDTVSKAADPGKFKDERKWPEWEPAFVNYTSTILGVTGVPLSYVLRENDQPDFNGTFESFNERAIACSPLSGPSFQADSRKVHQLLKSFLQTETAEQWIKPIAKKQSGRMDMKALRDHYSGEGNTSRRIAVAERIRDTLHYKNERAMQFSAFLDKLQKMFNIFEEENEEISEQAKVRMLLKKVEHPQLQNAVNALRVRASMDSTTFTECANHLSAQVSELPDYQASRKVAASNTKTTPLKRIRGGGGAQNSSSRKRNGINMPDGSIWTGYYSDWESMDKDDKQKVMDARKKNKTKGGKKNRQVSDVSVTPDKASLKDIKAQVAALKRSLSQLKSSSSDPKDNDNVEDDDTPDNAGDSFGGRSRKKSKKD